MEICFCKSTARNGLIVDFKENGFNWPIGNISHPLKVQAIALSDLPAEVNTILNSDGVNIARNLLYQCYKFVGGVFIKRPDAECAARGYQVDG